MTSSIKFPARLVWWRKKRGQSQMQLAMAASCSQRHISFLELGRTKPSREMLLRLSEALNVPLRQTNRPRNVNVGLTAERARSVRQALQQQGLTVNDDQLLNFSYMAPVACNDTPESRTKNRRVEIWLTP